MKVLNDSEKGSDDLKGLIFSEDSSFVEKYAEVLKFAEICNQVMNSSFNIYKQIISFYDVVMWQIFEYPKLAFYSFL